MTIAEATEMIRFTGGSIKKDPERWADLGCGTGTFTMALADLLAPRSGITAVDKDSGALERIPGNRNQVSITKTTAEMAGYIAQHQLRELDGVLMANALHFLKEQENFLRTLKRSLKPGGRLLLVEYDMEEGSRWVPYPLASSRAQGLLLRSGFSGFTPLSRRPSRYGPHHLYAALALAE